MKKPRLNFSPVAVSFWESIFGGDWPQFVRDLRGKSGVYIIRDRESKRTLYVGESHTGRLKKTLLRHFQAWSGKTAGQTYSRNAVEIAVEIVAPEKSVDRQNRLIATLQPRDNRISPAGPLRETNDDPF
jgi:excinuclease UvrABC nuclease subunit